jgi:hypothetical protein
VSKNSKVTLANFEPETIDRLDLVSRDPEPVSEAATAEAPALVVAPAKPTPINAATQGREAAASAPTTKPAKKTDALTLTGQMDHTSGLRTQRFLPKAEKRGTSLRLEPWLDDELNRKLFALKGEGFRKVTREHIVTEALILYLGVQRPPEATQ